MSTRKLLSVIILLICEVVLIVSCTPSAESDIESSNDNDNKDEILINICSDSDHTGKENWIFCDDFESEEPLSKRYFEYSDDDGEFIPAEGAGRGGGTAMRALFQQGEVSAGNIKKSFGRTPGSYIGSHAEMPDREFKEIYWHLDVRLGEGWTGGGGEKLTRATVFANDDWAQGLIAHLWSAGDNDNFLVMDPATGIDKEGNLVSTKYNDFEKLRWLGAKLGSTELFSSENAGTWFSVEAHIKLNTPGEPDGIFEFWINDELQAGSYDLNWHGNWNESSENYMINAIFIENYWNDGSVATQERYFDNFIISTERIGKLFN